MNLFNFIRSKVEKRSHVSPVSTHDLLIGRAVESEAGTIVNPLLAENLSAVFGCVQIIAETVASLPLQVYRRDGEDRRTRSDTHPIARLFSSDVNDRQTAFEWFEMMTAHCLLRGNAYAEIIRDNRGAVIALKPLHPNSVSVVESLRTGRIFYDVTDPNGGTRRLLPEEVLHLKDRSDDGIIGVSRLRRAREAFGTASATERFAASTYRNGAYLSGVIKHPDEIGPEAAQTIRESMAALHSGTGNAGRFAVLEEGMDWQAISVSPEDAQMLESRRFSVEQIARIYRIPPPVLGDLSNGSYSNVTELGRWFAGMTIRPWLDRWEQALSRVLLTEDGRRSHVLEFDMDLLMRGDMLARLQAYRIGREIGLYNANDLRRFENLNPRADDEAETYLSPLNMQSEQTRAPKEGNA